MTPLDEPTWNDRQDWKDDQPLGDSGQGWSDDGKDKDIPWSGQQGGDIPNLDQPSPLRHGADDIPNYLPNWITKPPIENSNPPPEENGIT